MIDLYYCEGRGQDEKNPRFYRKKQVDNGFFLNLLVYYYFLHLDNGMAGII